MKTQISVRLHELLLRELNREARKRRIRRSHVVREALEALVSVEVAGNGRLPYERVRDLVGGLTGGPPDLGEQHRKYLRDLILSRTRTKDAARGRNGMARSPLIQSDSRGQRPPAASLGKAGRL